MENKLQTAEEVDALYADGAPWNLAFEPEDMGLAVIDADFHHEGAAENLAAEHLPDTFVVQTPRGGEHHYFQGSVPSTTGKLAEHIDTRGYGGFALMVPSI